MVKGISVLGSTGSVGRQALEVAAFLGVRVRALAANGNIGLLREQILVHRPDIVSVGTREAAQALAAALGAEAACSGADSGAGSGTSEIAAGAGSRAAGGEGAPTFPEICFGEAGLCRAASETDAEMAVVAVSGAAGLMPAISALKAK
ncbi:MAG: hypothetical protein LBJ10_07800, partial [Clostridiales bacterium]|nr:hypothetical protein [Clostridiales bacterium]